MGGYYSSCALCTDAIQRAYKLWIQIQSKKSPVQSLLYYSESPTAFLTESFVKYRERLNGFRIRELKELEVLISFVLISDYNHVENEGFSFL